jgi:hypothetical protein
MSAPVPGSTSSKMHSRTVLVISQTLVVAVIILSSWQSSVSYATGGGVVIDDALDITVIPSALAVPAGGTVDVTLIVSTPSPSAKVGGAFFCSFTDDISFSIPSMIREEPRLRICPIFSQKPRWNKARSHATKMFTACFLKQWGYTIYKSQSSPMMSHKSK